MGSHKSETIHDSAECLLSLRGEGGGTHRERVTVSIPRGNLFTVESLKQIMDSVKRGEDL